MCGIVGYIGGKRTIGFMINKLKQLEYRGYDSAGLASVSDGELVVTKEVGNIDNLKRKADLERTVDSLIAHTRWATHGEPNENNAHPHLSSGEKWAVVHNGIIENYKELSAEGGFSDKLKSQTDTEVIAQMLEEDGVENISTFIDSCLKLEGSYALACISKSQPDCLYLAKNKSPLYCMKSGEEVMVASDPMCFAGFGEVYFPLEDKEFALVMSDRVLFYSQDKKEIEKKPVKLEIKEESIGKGEYAHFMIKEIMEQQDAVGRVVSTYQDNSISARLSGLNLKEVAKVVFIGCGTAFNAGQMGAKYIQKNAKISAEAVIASEFIYDDPIIDTKNLYVFVSQSGETADTISAIKMVKEKGCKTLALTNVLYSTLAKLADFVLPVCAGPEIAVASTKAYVCQICVLYILSKHFEEKRFGVEISAIEDIKTVQKYLFAYDVSVVEEIADRLKSSDNVIFIGKGLDSITAMEASLKLKEVAYIHTNSYPSGELKHGYLALVEKGTIVVAIATDDKISSKTINAANEAISRGAEILLIGNAQGQINPWKDIAMPDIAHQLLSIISVVPMQHIAYLTSIKRGINPDQPKNLAKSVTVE